MARHNDLNPFDEGGVNPFSDPAVRGKASSQQKFGGGSLYAADLRKKERELQAREAELDGRQKEVRRLEEAAARGKN